MIPTGIRSQMPRWSGLLLASEATRQNSLAESAEHFQRLPTKEPAFQGPQQLVARERLAGRDTTVLGGDAGIVVERRVRLLERVLELVALEQIVVGVRLLAATVLRVDGSPDSPDGAGLALDPDHYALRDACVVDSLEHPLGEDGGPVPPALHARTLARAVPRIESWAG